MKITNKYNLPNALVRAIENDGYSYTGNISVTQLISPPQLRWLTRRYWNSLEEDVTDRIWTLLGSAVHTILERAEDKHAADMQEVRLEAECDGWVWSGQADLWEAPDKVMDYKVTSGWAAIGDLKDEWKYQLNMLAYLYRQAGFPVNELAIVAIFRDWSKYKAMQSSDYPQKPAQTIDVPLMTDDEILDYVRERIHLHKESENVPDEELPPCTAKECWAKPTTYALMKNKNKRATRVLQTYEEAEILLAEHESKNTKDNFYIETRQGEFTRCEFYCPVKDYCHQYRNRMHGRNEIE